MRAPSRSEVARQAHTRASPLTIHCRGGGGHEGVGCGGGEGLASARVDDGLLGHHGEADRGKEGRLEHLPFSHELTHCKTCVASSPSHGRK